MADTEWTVERMRGMNRAEFAACIKRGDIPPPEVAAAFVKERLEQSVRQRERR